MNRTYMYVVDRDFGFAPNPFHGCCTLATCKPQIRENAQVNDWIIGMGGQSLEATGKCIFAMHVTEKLTFNEYWNNPEFFDKRPVRNGSRKMMVGDNIYYKKPDGAWFQADSHHSQQDGSINPLNMQKDTRADSVLVSGHFFYFGKAAPLVPENILNEIGYSNGRGHRVFDSAVTDNLIGWLYNSFCSDLNLVVADPFNFSDSEKRYSGEGSKVI